MPKSIRTLIWVSLLACGFQLAAEPVVQSGRGEEAQLGNPARTSLLTEDVHQIKALVEDLLPEPTLRMPAGQAPERKAAPPLHADPNARTH